MFAIIFPTSFRGYQNVAVTENSIARKRELAAQRNGEERRRERDRGGEKFTRYGNYCRASNCD